jgi:hypothetical protein
MGGEIEGYKVLQFRKKSDPQTYEWADCYTQEACQSGGFIHATPIE